MIGVITIAACAALFFVGAVGWILWRRLSEQLDDITFRLKEQDEKLEDILYLLQQGDDGVEVEVYERDMLLETMSA